MTFSDLAKSFARTVVPAVVGMVVALGIRSGVDLNGYAPEISVAVTAVYYALARLAEHYVSPAFGWLLGYAQTPLYGAVGHLKVKRGETGPVSQATIKEITASLRAIEKQARRTADATEAAHHRRNDRGDGGVLAIVLVAIILIIFLGATFRP